jgi:hypothetical protein
MARSLRRLRAGYFGMRPEPPRLRAAALRALAADPDHRLASSFYGIMHAGMGARDKAVGMLRRLRNICGGASCSEFRALFLEVTGGGG